MEHRFFLVCFTGLLLVIGGCGDGKSGGAATAVDEFDPTNRNRAAFWWAGLVSELTEAKASGNEVRVDEVIQKIDAARAPLVGQRIRFLFNVWQTNPDLPETVWDYKPISSEGVWVGILHRADNARIHVGVKYHDTRMRGYIYPFQLKPGEHIDPTILGSLSTKSTFEISATISQTGVARLDTWHQGMKRFSTPPTLLLFINDIKVETVNP